MQWDINTSIDADEMGHLVCCIYNVCGDDSMHNLTSSYVHSAKAALILDFAHKPFECACRLRSVKIVERIQLICDYMVHNS